MTKNIDMVIKMTDKLRTSASDCSSSTLTQAVEVAIHIERAFYEEEINDKERASRHKTLDDLIDRFKTKCECKEEMGMTFD